MIQIPKTENYLRSALEELCDDEPDLEIVIDLLRGALNLLQQNRLFEAPIPLGNPTIGPEDEYYGQSFEGGPPIYTGEGFSPTWVRSQMLAELAKLKGYIMDGNNLVDPTNKRIIQRHPTAADVLDILREVMDSTEGKVS